MDSIAAGWEGWGRSNAMHPLASWRARQTRHGAAALVEMDPFIFFWSSIIGGSFSTRDAEISPVRLTHPSITRCCLRLSAMW
ncbi:hypothetical protein HYQ46_005046 [Verticillium longisporum]|nr:hypothetical protein HYQ46_005046 [Verticillium longisporum]